MGITIKQIAKKSGFGVGTVSRALSDDDVSVKAETRQKILAIAQKYGYVKNASAQALASKKSRDIGLVIPAYFKSPFYSDFYIKTIAGGIEQLSGFEKVKGYKLRILFLRDKNSFSELLQESQALKLGGLILTPYCRDFFIQESDIKKLEIPVVVLSQEIDGPNIRSVVLDDFKGGYDGTKFLIALGHRRIGVIRGFYEDIEERFGGYKQALNDYGISLREEYIMKGNALQDSGYDRTIKLLRLKDKPTAIFALDDEMAYGALEAIRTLGLRCPDDISVMGFDGIEISRFTTPALTTVVRPVEKMGKVAVRLLVDSDMWKKEKVIKVEGEVVARKSCMAIG
ncbi:MAG: LacI family DNA-binding transcriptional regulator [Candidatus Omnitrophica bacterium]|nr:LacI family DNA-binding transcriptional regulator [Candidatus Omnitrophota bacterium]